VLDVGASLQATFPLVELPPTERLERAVFISLAAVARQVVHDAPDQAERRGGVHGLGHSACGPCSCAPLRLASGSPRST
jgi:hypothetical protein